MLVAALLPLLPFAAAHGLGHGAGHHHARAMGCGGHEIARRNPGGSIVLDHRQVANNIEDPVQECTAYTYQPMVDIAAQFPTAWVPADLVAGDTEAATLFATINASLNAALPNDLVKGNGLTHNGDWTGVVYDIATDPDCWWTQKQCHDPKGAANLAADIISTPEPDSTVLGFDDGPNCSHNALYNFLSDNNQKATMFFIGSNVHNWPVQAKRAVDDGHEICVHTWSHMYMTSFSNQQAFAELYYTRKIIKDILGVTTQCWRAPYGDVDNRIRYIANALNLTTILWSNDTFDWEVGAAGYNTTQQDVNNNYGKIITAAQQGEYASGGPIFLNHEINNFTMQEFTEQYANLKSAFKYMVPYATAYNITHPYVEQNVSFPTFDEYTNGETTSNGSSDATASGASGTGTTAAAGSSTAKSKSGTGMLAAPLAGILAVAGLVAVVL